MGAGVRAVVAQSWERSGEAGVDPENIAPIVMDDREVEERWSRHPLYPVLPVLRDLLASATSESAHMLVISDAVGVLMWMEGHHRVVEDTHDMHLVRGADWSERRAGTNALGTAIAVDHPVQIFSAEHYNRVVHPWQCSGAPIHDPATREILGVVDLTGHLRTAHPHTLALVTAAAGMAEVYLHHDQARRDEQMRDAYLQRIAGSTQPSALVRPSGHVVLAVPHACVPSRVSAPTLGEDFMFADGRAADVEQLPGHQAFVVWCRQPGRRASPATRASSGVRLELFGRRPRVVLSDGGVPLSGRHAEILAVLALRGRGRTSEELTLDVYGEAGKTVTLRAEISRLRRILGDVLLARPYAFRHTPSSDLQDAERLLSEGRIADAMGLAHERALPDSVSPVVIEARERLEGGLRAAILATGDPVLMHAWCRSGPGSEDELAARALLGSLPAGDSRRASATAHLSRLERLFAA